MSANIDTIISSSFTKPQVIKRLGLLHDFLNYWLFSGKLSLEEALIEFVKLNPESKLIGSFSPEFFKQFNQQNMTEMLKELKDQVDSFKVLTITLAVDLPEDQIIKMGQYLRTNFSERFLIELKIDPSLIAGAALTWGGSYKDYSLKAKIAQNRNAILEDFKKGLH